MDMEDLPLPNESEATLSPGDNVEKIGIDIPADGILRETNMETGETKIVDPIVFDTTPTVPLHTVGTTAAAPPAPGRDAVAIGNDPAVAGMVQSPGTVATGVVASSPANPQTVSSSVNSEKEKSILETVQRELANGCADLFETTKQAIQPALAYYGPMIARQAVLESMATTEDALKLAETNKRHLQGQALMKAGEYGIPLQQRTELRFLAILTAATNAGLKALRV